ncbi:MAG: acetolactate synthase small subunit [Chloroflexota bacterium]
MRTKHTVVALMEDQPGVLNRVVSLFRRRGFNIDSLTVGPSEIPQISRMTVVVNGTTEIVEQVVKQLYKVVDVLKVSDISNEKIVVRELALIKVSATQATRSEIMQIVDIYRAKIVDVAIDSVIIEATGPEDKIDSLVELLKRFGIKEMARTGRVVMVRSAIGSTKWNGN